MPRTYIAIDLKSFFASVECVERGLNPLTTNLVVADESRTDKTICLAVSPSLKAHGIGGRARLFEVNQRLREVNIERKFRSPGKQLTCKSWKDEELQAHPDWEVDFITAPPRMAQYIRYSTKIYQIYLRYVSAEDVHVYSIDEVMMDVTNYLATYRKSAHELAMEMIQAVLKETGITATAGIGTNLYLCKVAMDIVAKHIPADKDGVRIAELDEMTYRKLLWNHRPLTNFWRIGRGIARKLEAHGLDTMGKVARCSLLNEDLLYKLFGVNAELIIDHAWGWEPCTIEEVKAYRPETNSLSVGQVLTCPYEYRKARVVIEEMADGMALELVSKRLVANQLVIAIAYDVMSLGRPDARDEFQGEVVMDFYGRIVPKPAHGSANLKCHTSSSRMLCEAALAIFDHIVDRGMLIRKMNLTVNHVITEKQAEELNHAPVQMDLFTDYEALAEKERRDSEKLAKERKIQEALLDIKKRYGKNAILRGLNLAEGATAIERNKQIGGHKA